MNLCKAHTYSVFICSATLIFSYRASCGFCAIAVIFVEQIDREDYAAVYVYTLCIHLQCLFQLLQYIADAGGILGLWFGFAIMTFIEFFEFFLDSIVLTINKIRTSLSKAVL